MNDEIGGKQVTEVSDIFQIEPWEIAGRLFFAAFLGGIVGWERERDNHPAGFRTHILVSMGSALFGILSIYGFTQYNLQRVGDSVHRTGDASRLAAQIIPGIGFLGAGTIFRHGSSVSGLTTAASLWVVAGIGLAVGSGQFWMAGIATVFTLVSLEFLNRLEGLGFKRRIHVLRITIQGNAEKIKEISSIIVQHGGIIRNLKVGESDLPSQKIILIFTFKARKGINFTELYDDIASVSGVQKLKAR